MNIEQMNTSLTRYKKCLENLPNKRLGFMLKEYYYANLSKNTKGDIIENDKFSISVSPHDTGVSVYSSIKLPDGSLYKFAYRTYWYDEHTYGFNKWNYESGKWDEAYNEFIEELRNELKEYYEKNITVLEKMIYNKTSELEKERQYVESLFN